MPAKSVRQQRYIFFLRGKYKTKEKTPNDKKWIWESGWEKLDTSAKNEENEGTRMDFYLMRTLNENASTMNQIADDKFHMLLEFGIRTKEAAENLLKGFGIDTELMKKILDKFTR